MNSNAAENTIGAPLPRSVPIIAEDRDNQTEPRQSFQEGAQDVLDPDLRSRMIREDAYALYAQRGYADGFDVADWLAAEAEVDRVLVDRPRPGARSARKAEPPGLGASSAG